MNLLCGIQLFVVLLLFLLILFVVDHLYLSLTVSSIDKNIGLVWFDVVNVMFQFQFLLCEPLLLDKGNLCDY